MDERCKALWEKLSAALKPQVSADTFKRWFSAVELTKATEDELTWCIGPPLRELRQRGIVVIIDERERAARGEKELCDNHQHQQRGARDESRNDVGDALANA